MFRSVQCSEQAHRISSSLIGNAGPFSPLESRAAVGRARLMTKEWPHPDAAPATSDELANCLPPSENVAGAEPAFNEKRS
jgi:hypothetical protein